MPTISSTSTPRRPAAATRPSPSCRRPMPALPRWRRKRWPRPSASTTSCRRSRVSTSPSRARTWCSPAAARRGREDRAADRHPLDDRGPGAAGRTGPSQGCAQRQRRGGSGDGDDHQYLRRAGRGDQGAARRSDRAHRHLPDRQCRRAHHPDRRAALRRAGMAKILTASDLELFRRDGYLCPLPCLSESEAGATLRVLEDFEIRHGGFGKRLRFKAHLRLVALLAIARHPSILDAVEDLIGPNILLFTSTLWPKDGGDGRFVSWHQDSAYFGLDPHAEVTAWIALTASNRANGCVRVMPGSHRGVDYSHDETHAPDNLLIRGQTIRGLDETKAANLELRPGQFSLHQERTV